MSNGGITNGYGAVNCPRQPHYGKAIFANAYPPIEFLLGIDFAYCRSNFFITTLPTSSRSLNLLA